MDFFEAAEDKKAEGASAENINEQACSLSNRDMRLEAILINRVTLLLAEKRTSLSVMRTGLTILALPISVLSVLVVISKYYDPIKVIYLLVPLLTLCVFLTVLGAYMITKSFRRISRIGNMIADLKQRNAHLKSLSIIVEETKPDRDF